MPSSPSTWIELAVASHHPEFAEEILLACGALSVTMTDAADVPVLEPLPGETPLWPATITRGLFNAGTDLDTVRAALAEQLPDGDTAGTELLTVEDRDWVRAWLDHAEAMQFGERLWICPTGCEVTAQDAVIVHLDPGLAFGTGTHPSTSMCLDWLSLNAIDGAAVLDYGCGSGVLAIAALKLGAASALAIDIDPQAITATLDNAATNQVAERIRCAGIDHPPLPQFDLVLANILARPLIELAPKLAAATRTGGHVVLAGLLERQAEEVRAAYAPWFDFEADGERDGWNRISGVKRG
ncbi:MAG: 50S ribosomal protein L11 methyltransferase [Nevskia sp.]|uniref:50S ribosomal protein L11 methyltransferase n=1 Tax=Nevskia sp. TaxID=1929292 RepID=UPI0040371436